MDDNPLNSGNLRVKYQYILDQISQVPSLPSIVSHLLKQLNDPHSNADSIVSWLELDLGLSGKVLRLANSAYYGIPGQVNTIQRAVVQLGFNAIQSLILSTSVFNLFRQNRNFNEGPVGLNRKIFWNHSIETALYCRMIAKLCPENPDPEIAFTQGILHDLGVLVMDESFPQEYAIVLNKSSLSEEILHIEENELFGLNHSQIGARILRKWQIPDIISTPVLYHHDLASCPEFQNYTAILGLANLMSHKIGLYTYHKQKTSSKQIHFFLSALQLNLSEQQLQEQCMEAFKQTDVIQNLLRN